MTYCRIIFILGALAGFCGGAAAAQSAKPARAGEITEEVVTLSAADGLQLSALLSLPSARVSSGGPLIVLLPDGPGGTPLKATDPARYIGRGLARLGYATLSLETRHTVQYPYVRFDEAFVDVKAAVDLAASRGFSTVVLGGAGLGSLLAVRYVAESDDTRVKGVIAYGPSVDLPEAWRAKVGEETYARTVERATKAATDSASGFIDLGSGMIFTPNIFLDWYGPAAKTSLSASLAALDRPVLLAAGENDASVPASRLQRLAQAVGSKKVVTHTYPGAGHDLSKARDKVIADTAAWLAAIDVIPPPHVATTVVDTVTKDGVSLTGLLYTPANAPSASSRRPTFLLLHGLNGDAMRSVNEWLAMRLAQHGYVVLAARTRGAGFRNTLMTKFDDIPKDIAAWSDFLAARGSTRLIGVGHAVGGLWLSTYLSESQDKRFRGAIYLGPPRDLPAYGRHAMGDAAYDRAVQAAQAAVKAGKGATTLIEAPFPQVSYPDDPHQPMFLAPQGPGLLSAYADAFLSYWGPKSLAVHSERVAGVHIPILALGGSRDPMMQGGWLLQFIKDASSPAASIFYGGPNGARASFDGFENKVVDDVIGWTQRLP